MGNDLKAQLVLNARNMAVTQRKPDSVIHHNDQRAQYTSLAFGLRCKEMGIRPSMRTVGDAYDNAMCKRFFATLDCELPDRRKFKTKAEARIPCFERVESWYTLRAGILLWDTNPRSTTKGPLLKGWKLYTHNRPQNRRNARERYHKARIGVGFRR